MGSSMLLAQKPSHEQYVKEAPEGSTWYEMYKDWTPGVPSYSNYDDEEFYISRVKPKERFSNVNTQVDETMDSSRKLIWWCPIGTAGWNATPSYLFDSEVFSMWSYVDIYGNWTAPFIRMPAAFMDVCHKNGVKTSVLASVPWASSVTATDGGHGSNMRAMIDGGAEKLLKYLRYYGIDGIGYNSEFNIGTGLSALELKSLLSECFAKREDAKWPTFTNAWYSLMSNNGSVGGTDHLSGSNIDWFQYNGNPTSDAYFMNYNWGSYGLGIAQQTAENAGRSSYDVYGGMDFQGRSAADWIALKDYKISVGIWGAHDMNMIFEGRGELGAAPLQKQKAYQLISENVFTGSSYNPVNTPEITNLLAHTSLRKDFHGFSSFITARSSLTTTDLGKEPFVTYFNLGNGLFFNIEGEKEFPNQWYNIGIQDYLPTWRWWWTNTFMGRMEKDVPAKGMTAEFTWDDAWFGGSSLAISGASEREYLQLFKTKYHLVTGDKLLIRYKVVGGTGSLKWACSAEGAEVTEVNATINAQLEDTEGKWIEKIVTVGNGRTNLKLADKTMALMGLKFENTSSDFKILIGEISLTRNTAATPHRPTIIKQELLASNYLGVDFKIIFKMKDRSTDNPEEPIYNSDVDTWFYKVYAQQEGEEEIMATATTSWAAYVVSTPYNTGGKQKMRIGVSAVSLDGKSESEISWSDYMDIPNVEIVEGIEIDKNVIKENEEFTVKYKDPGHPKAKWEILNAQTGESVVDPVMDQTEITTSLPQIGIYDLRLTCGEEVAMYQGVIQISGDEVGALPKIQTLKANDSEESINVEINSPVEFSYTGREADGHVSRGLMLSEKAFGIPCEQLGFNTSSPFSISFWFNPVRFNHAENGTQLLNIRTAADKWPASDWGFIWSTIGLENKYSISFRRTGNEGTQIDVDDFVFGTNQWYHFALVADFQNGSRLVTLYINGRKIKTSDPFNDLYAWTNSNLIMVGGKAFKRAGLDGFIDEFQLYDRALTDEEILKSMEHQTVIPKGLVGYWDFESDPQEDGYIYSTGTNTNLKAGTVESKTISEGHNEYIPVQSTFGAGAPFIPGTNYVITTVPSWSMGKGIAISNIEGNAESGKATINYANEGMYSTTLTLTNGWGTDSKTFNYVMVTKGVGIEDDELKFAYNAYPNPFINDVNVRFAETGVYDVEVYNILGKLISTQQVSVSSGEYKTISINGVSSTYFINIKQGDKTIKALKVIKK